MKYFALALVVTLALIGCSEGDSEEWTSEEYTSLIAYCAGLDGINPSGCPDVANLARSLGCSIETAYYAIGRVADRDREAFQAALAECGPSDS